MEFLPSWTEIVGVIPLIGIYVILALSLNVICGMTGLLQLGHAGFYAIGAYTAGLLAVYCTIPAIGWVELNLGFATLDVPWGNLLIACGAAMVVAGAASLIIGVPCLRLRGDYLAIATLGFGEIVIILFRAIQFPGNAMTWDEPFGGPSGISFTDEPSLVWPDNPEYWEYSARYSQGWVVWLFVLLTFVILLNIKRSRAGRAFMTIREDEIAASAMGINTSYYKIVAFMLSAAFAGLAGALYFHYQPSIEPANFTLLISIQILVMVVLGGMGSLSGSLLAAVLLGMLPIFLSHLNFGRVEALPAALRINLGEYKEIVFAALLVVLIRLAPNGLLGMRELPGFLCGCAAGKHPPEDPPTPAPTVEGASNRADEGHGETGTARDGETPGSAPASGEEGGA